jgi:DNA-binding IclR family transcriptional regulator
MDDLNSVLGKSFAILDAVADHGELRVSEIVRITGVPKTTAHRLVGRLCEWGALHEDGGVYRLGIRMFEMGRAVLTVRRLCEVARPYLLDLYQVTDGVVHLGIRVGREALVVEKVAGHGPLPATTDVGTRLPLHSNALGKALLLGGDGELLGQLRQSGLQPLTPYTIVEAGLLAEQLLDAGRRGYTTDFEELRIGVGSVAAPVRSRHRLPIAAVAVTMPAGRFRPTNVAPAIVAAAAALSRELAESSRGHLLATSGA